MLQQLIFIKGPRMNLLVVICKRIFSFLYPLFYSDEAVGDTKIRKKFLFFKKTINGETRCYKFARWKECCVRAVATPLGLVFAWKPVEWVD